MPETTSFAPGTPSWVDLATPSTAEAAAFYEPLLGWTSDAPGPDDQTGGYRMFLLDGRPVAGATPIVTEGHPPSWNTYITVEDADATTAAAREAGGTVLAEPMDVLTFGRMAALIDPSGAPIAIWQPRDHIGAGIVNEPGALCWNELTTREPGAARAFYAAVFGWEAAETTPGGQPYTVWRSGGKEIGGMITMDEQWPAEIPPHWMVYFAVEDTDAVAGHARELGGTVSVEPFDIPVGRFAVLQDPHGAVFSVIAMAQPA